MVLLWCVFVNSKSSPYPQHKVKVRIYLFFSPLFVQEEIGNGFDVLRKSC